MKTIRFRVLKPIIRHTQKLFPAVEFEIKSTSSRVHVDRWLAEGRIEEISGEEPTTKQPNQTMKTPSDIGAAKPSKKQAAAVAPSKANTAAAGRATTPVNTVAASAKQPPKAAAAPRATTAATAASSGAPPSGAKDSAPIAKTAKEVSAQLDGLLRKAIALSGCSSEAEFQKLPREERNAFMSAARGADIARGNGAESGEVMSLDPETVCRSPFNRLIDEDDQDFRDLVADVRENGVLQNGVVRPAKNHPDPKIKWEIIAGEGRWQAALRAGRRYPAVCRDVDDTRAIEIQAIENMKRRNLNPIDEAVKYDQLLNAYVGEGMTRKEAVAKIVEKTGKGDSTIYERLTLFSLPEEVKEAVRKGLLPPSHAGLLPKIKDPDTIRKTAALMIHHEGGLMPFRDAKGVVEYEVQREKNIAEWEKLKAEYEAKGWRVIEPEECEKIFHCNDFNDWWSIDQKSRDTYVKGDDWVDLPNAYRPYEKLWKKAPNPILGRLDNGRAVVVYLKMEAVEAVHKGGKLKATAGRSSSRPASEVAAEKHCKAKRAEYFTAAAAIVAKVENELDSKSFWQTFTKMMVRQWRGDPLKLLAKRRGWGKRDEAYDQAEKRMEEMSLQELRGLCMELLVGASWPSTYQSSWGDAMTAAAKLTGVKLPAWKEGKAGSVQTSGIDEEGDDDADE